MSLNIVYGPFWMLRGEIDIFIFLSEIRIFPFFHKPKHGKFDDAWDPPLRYLQILNMEFFQQIALIITQTSGNYFKHCLRSLLMFWNELNKYLFFDKKQNFSIFP